MSWRRSALWTLLIGWVGCQATEPSEQGTAEVILTSDNLLRATPGWLEQHIGEPLPTGRQFEIGDEGVLHVTFGDSRVIVFTPLRSIPTPDSLLGRFAMDVADLDCDAQEGEVVCAGEGGLHVTARESPGGWSYLRLEGPRPEGDRILSSNGPLPSASLALIRGMTALHDDAVIAGGDSVLHLYSADAVVVPPNGAELRGDSLRDWLGENAFPSTLAVSEMLLERSEDAVTLTSDLVSGESIEMVIRRRQFGELEGRWAISRFAWQ